MRILEISTVWTHEFWSSSLKRMPTYPLGYNHPIAMTRDSGKDLNLLTLWQLPCGFLDQDTLPLLPVGCGPGSFTAFLVSELTGDLFGRGGFWKLEPSSLFTPPPQVFIRHISCPFLKSLGCLSIPFQLHTLSALLTLIVPISKYGWEPQTWVAHPSLKRLQLSKKRKNLEIHDRWASHEERGTTELWVSWMLHWSPLNVDRVKGNCLPISPSASL